MAMIYACPNCGNSLPKPLQDGICICTYCNVLFDSSAQSRLLAAAWIVRKKNYTFDQMRNKLKLSDQESAIIEQKIKPKLWVFGDSFTQTFKSHFETNNDWATKYKEYKRKQNVLGGSTPRNYSEIIADSLNIDLENHGIGGCSNQTIFDNFLTTFLT